MPLTIEDRTAQRQAAPFCGKHMEEILLRGEVVRDALVDGATSHVDHDLLLHTGLHGARGSLTAHES